MGKKNGGGGGGGGAGLLSLFFIHRLGPSIYCLPPPPPKKKKKKNQEYQAPPKIWNFCNNKIYPQSVILPTIHRNGPRSKSSPILWWPPPPPPPIASKSLYPQNIIFFWKNPKTLKFKMLNPTKWSELTSVWKFQSTPPPPPFAWKSL